MIRTKEVINNPEGIPCRVPNTELINFEKAVKVLPTKVTIKVVNIDEGRCSLVSIPNLSFNHIEHFELLSPRYNNAYVRCEQGLFYVDNKKRDFFVVSTDPDVLAQFDHDPVINYQNLTAGANKELHPDALKQITSITGHAHKARPPAYSLYGGRCKEYIKPGQPLLGNPFKLINEADRDKICDEHADWLSKPERTPLLEELDVWMDDFLTNWDYSAGQAEIILACHCAPSRCHCDALADKIKERLEARYSQLEEVEIQYSFYAMTLKEAVKMKLGIEPLAAGGLLLFNPSPEKIGDSKCINGK